MGNKGFYKVIKKEMLRNNYWFSSMLLNKSETIGFATNSTWGYLEINPRFHFRNADYSHKHTFRLYYHENFTYEQIINYMRTNIYVKPNKNNLYPVYKFTLSSYSDSLNITTTDNSFYSDIKRGMGYSIKHLSKSHPDIYDRYNKTIDGYSMVENPIMQEFDSFESYLDFTTDVKICSNSNMQDKKQGVVYHINSLKEVKKDLLKDLEETNRLISINEKYLKELDS